MNSGGPKPDTLLCGRQRLPNKRPHISLQIAGGRLEGITSISCFPDGNPAEAFLEVGKPGDDIDLICRDAACVFSIALQYGAPASVIAKALGRLENNAPATIIGAMADAAAQCEGTPT